MTSPLATAILKTGLIDDEVIREIRKWGISFEGLDHKEEGKPRSLKDLVHVLENALQSAEMVAEKVTDADAIRVFLATQKIGTLHVHIEGQSASFDVPYGKNNLGEYIFPWQGETLADELTNGITYLLPDPKNEENKVFFNSVRELYYGDQKAFMVCAPSPQIQVV